jgi:predicted nuclease of predicted toxin-antitoxin system
MKKTIVADESVDFRIVKELRRLDVKVFAICEELPSISDKMVLDIATSKNSILITEDKDFGELVFRLNFLHKGIVLIRMGKAEFNLAKVAEVIVSHYDELYGKFSILSEKKLRIKE